MIFWDFPMFFSPFLDVFLGFSHVFPISRWFFGIFPCFFTMSYTFPIQKTMSSRCIGPLQWQPGGFHRLVARPQLRCRSQAGCLVSKTYTKMCILINWILIDFFVYIYIWLYTHIYYYYYYYYYYPQAPCVAQAQNSVNYKDFLFTLYISYKFSQPR